MAEAPNDSQYDEIKRKLVGRIAFAGVAAVVLLAGLAIFDRMVETAPPSPPGAPAARAPLPQLPSGDGAPPSSVAPVEVPPPGSSANDTGALSAASEISPPPASVAPAAPGIDLPQPGSAVSLPADRSPATPRRVLAERQVEAAPPAIPETSALPQEPPPPVVAAVPSEPVPEATGGDVRPARRQAAPTRLTHGYLLQVGVFGNAQRAGELYDRLLRAGVPAKLETRVQVGPFVTRQEADQARERLKALGIESLLLPARAP